MLGFRGHFATKSRRYSVTLGRLRTARRRWQTAQLRKQRQAHGPAVEAGHDQADDTNETTLVIGNWEFAGIGWRTAGDAALAAESAALAREYADQQRQRRAATRSLPAPR